MKWLVRGLTILVVAGALALALSVAARGSDGASAKAIDGVFTLELASPRIAYFPGEAITGITATLTYQGSRPTAQIGHAYVTPIGFGIVEPVNGIMLAPGWLESCEASTLTPGVGLSNGFAKSGGSLTSDPGFIAFMQDPVLRLPPGTWHIYAEAMFSEGGCAGDNRHDVRAEITLDVE